MSPGAGQEPVTGVLARTFATCKRSKGSGAQECKRIAGRGQEGDGVALSHDHVKQEEGVSCDVWW